jgi:lipid II isoglutaminyl synthase (glutamine-hydrolysing)
MNQINITHLYPKKMSLYGDWGNVRALEYRLIKMGYKVNIQNIDEGQDIPEHSDFLFMGGGQDTQQLEIFQDLLGKKQQLLDLLETCVPMLAICGGYQLLGKTFLTGKGEVVQGIGFFDVETKSTGTGKENRCIGNVIVQTQLPGLEGVSIVGFENHGGKTFFLSEEVTPLGKVIVGKGNNGQDGLEGCLKNNTIGSYLHGSVLPKNPELTDWFIARVLEVKSKRYPAFKILNKVHIDDSIVSRNKEYLIKKFSS